MDFDATTYRHELPAEYLAFMAKQKGITKDFEKLCNEKAEENPMRRLEYHQIRNDALLRQEGTDYALRCLGYEWNDTAKRYELLL